VRLAEHEAVLQSSKWLSLQKETLEQTMQARALECEQLKNSLDSLLEEHGRAQRNLANITSERDALRSKSLPQGVPLADHEALRQEFQALMAQHETVKQECDALRNNASHVVPLFEQEQFRHNLDDLKVSQREALKNALECEALKKANAAAQVPPRVAKPISPRQTPRIIAPAQALQKSASGGLLVVFKPGRKIGIVMNDSGIVTKVDTGGPAERSGVRVGMGLQGIDDKAYNKSLLRERCVGRKDFTITFSRALKSSLA